MSVQFQMPNGELIVVPPEIVGAEDSAKALQGFYDGQAQRIADELGVTVEELHKPKAGGSA